MSLISRFCSTPRTYANQLLFYRPFRCIKSNTTIEFKVNHLFLQNRFYSSDPSPKKGKIREYYQYYNECYHHYKSRTTEGLKYCKHEMTEGFQKEWREEFLRKGPTNLLKWMIFGGVLTGISSQYSDLQNELNTVKKNLDEIEKIIRETFVTIKEIEVFPRMHLFDGFDPHRVESDILKLKTALGKIQILKNDPEKWNIFKTFFTNPISSLWKNICEQEKMLQVSLAILETILFYNKREFLKAKQKLEDSDVNSVLEAWKGFFLKDENSGTGKLVVYHDIDGVLDDWKAPRHEEIKRLMVHQDQIQELLCGFYNMYGLVLRAKAKMQSRDQDFTFALKTLITGLKIALYSGDPEKQIDENKNILDVLREGLDAFFVRVATAETKEKETYGVFLSNLGFLLNQWSKHDEALRCHKAAYDLLPKYAATINGLAFGLAHKGIAADNDKQLKEELYKEAHKFYGIGLVKFPRNEILLTNKAELFLEMAEEEKDNKKKQEYYESAKNLLEPLISETEEKGSIKFKKTMCIYYAVALSNIPNGDRKRAEEYMKKAKVICYDDTRLLPYVDHALSQSKPYQLPPIDSNRGVRKTHLAITRPYDPLIPARINFFENNVKDTRIETQRTIIRPIQLDDRLFIWQNLYGNKGTMTKYHNRIPRDFQKVNDSVIGWHNLFNQGIPYSAYVVVSKEAPEQRIGLIVIEASEEHDARPGLCQLFYLFSPDYQREKYGAESLRAFVNEFVTQKLARNPRFLVQNQDLETIELSALTDNVASIILIEDNLNGTLLHEEDRHGGKRKIYRINL